MRGIAPLVIGRRVVAMHLYDRRLRWSVPRWLPARIKGRTIDALDRRSKYLLFRLAEDTLLVHFGMTGSLRAHRAPPPRRTHDHVDIVLDSGVTLRYHDPRRFGAMLWLPSPAERHPLLASLGPSRSTRRATPTTCGRATRRRSGGGQVGADGQSSYRRYWQYLRQRVAVPRRDPADDPANRVSKARLARLLTEVRATLTDAIAKGRVDAAGLRRQPRRARLFSARLRRLRARRAPLPQLRRRHTPDPARRSRHVLLPGLPALTGAKFRARRSRPP
mgnify:CR=1 FL=1